MYKSKLSQQLVDSGALDHNDLRTLWLDALEAAGVDNWSGMDEAIHIYIEYLTGELERNV